MAISVTLQIAMYVLIGVVVRRLKLVSENFTRDLTRFVMDVSLPCLVINALSSQSHEDFGAEAVLQLFLAGIAFFVILMIAAQIVFVLFKKTDTARCLRFCTVFSNFTFVGVPVMEGLYGAEGLFAFMLFYTPLRILYYIMAPILINPNHATDLKARLRELKEVLLTPAIIATAIGIALYLLQVRLPAFLSNTISAVGSTCSPLAMIISGMTLGGMSRSQMAHDGAAWSIVGVSNFLSPAIMLAAALVLPFPDQLRMIMVLTAAMPVPSLLITYTIRFGLSERLCQSTSLAMFASTLLSVASIPLWIAVAEWIIL